MRLLFPPHFTAATLHSLWMTVEAERADGARTDVLDLSNLKLLDPEGTNYVALIPEFLRSRGTRISIVLPKSERVRSYAESVGLLEYLRREFDVVSAKWGRTAGTPRDGQLFDEHRRFLPNSLGIHVSKQGGLRESSIPARFQAAARKLGEPAAARVGVCFLELTQNVFDHSQQTCGCVTFHVRRFRRTNGAERVRLFIAVSDLGIGINASLAERFAQSMGTDPASVTDEECLQFAVLPGSSRHPLSVRGWGLHRVRTSADQLRLSSGKATITWRGNRAPALRAAADLHGTSAVAEFEA